MRIIPATVLAIFYVFAAAAVWAVDITITIVNPGDGVPSAISLNPSSVTTTDTGTSGTVLSVAAVTMSDASTFTGTLASSDASRFGISGLDVILARDLTLGDAGFHNVTINAGTASATLSVQVTAPSLTTPLLGLYQGLGTSPAFHQWAGRRPDYTIDWSFMGPGYGSSPSNNGGYPTVIDISTTGNTACTSFASAASGACDGDYQATLNNLVLAYASHIYAIRVNSEWTQAGAFSGPFDGSCNVRIDAATWRAGVQHLVNVIRSNSALNNVKIELEAPMSARDQAYWPGDNYIDLTGFDRYFFSQFDGTSVNAWDIAQNQVSPCFTNINTGSAWGAAHGKPLMISEWCDTYTDGYVLSHFADWMKSNNVVAQSYWDSNDAISSPAGCRLLDYPARQAAYAAAFGSSTYSGGYWNLLAIPSNSY